MQNVFAEVSFMLLQKKKNEEGRVDLLVLREFCAEHVDWRWLFVEQKV